MPTLARLETRQAIDFTMAKDIALVKTMTDTGRIMVYFLTLSKNWPSFIIPKSIASCLSSSLK